MKYELPKLGPWAAVAALVAAVVWVWLHGDDPKTGQSRIAHYAWWERILWFVCPAGIIYLLWKGRY